jgi:hypothetical protein
MINNKKEFKMIQKLKHLKYFSNYISEQEFGEGMDPAGGEIAQAAPTDPVYSFIFIDKKSEGEHKYPDGSSSKRFDTYSVTKSELNKWLETHVTSGLSGVTSDNAAVVKRKAIAEYISGLKSAIAPGDKDLVVKFKASVTTETIGKQEPKTEVTFSPKNNSPTTDIVEVTFITVG